MGKTINYALLDEILTGKTRPEDLLYNGGLMKKRQEYTDARNIASIGRVCVLSGVRLLVP